MIKILVLSTKGTSLVFKRLSCQNNSEASFLGGGEGGQEDRAKGFSINNYA